MGQKNLECTETAYLPIYLEDIDERQSLEGALQENKEGVGIVKAKIEEFSKAKPQSKASFAPNGQNFEDVDFGEPFIELDKFNNQVLLIIPVDVTNEYDFYGEDEDLTYDQALDVIGDNFYDRLGDLSHFLENDEDVAKVFPASDFSFEAEEIVCDTSEDKWYEDTSFEEEADFRYDIENDR